MKESTCNVQLVQVLAHEATLNFSLDETISAMMVHIGDAVQSTGKTALQDRATSLLGTLLLANDRTGPCDGAHGRDHTGFRLVQEREERFQRACGILETRVAAEFESCKHGSSATAAAHIFSFLVGCGSH